MDILATAKKIGTYEISSEPFHDCCPVFMPRTPELSASPRELDEAEANLDVASLVAQGARGATLEKFAYTGGRVEADTPKSILAADQSRAAIA
jgi:hypothetical protein